MKNEFTRFSSRIKLGLPVIVLLFLFVAASAQTKVEPVPENVKVVEQPDSPVQVSLGKMDPLPGDFNTLGFIIRNSTTKSIRSIVMLNNRGGVIVPIYLGLPGMRADLPEIHSSLEGGVSRPQSYPIVGLDRKSTESTLSVDFVLFWDGTTWGPNSAGEADFLLGIFEGQKLFLSEVKKLVAKKDDDGLRALILRDGPPPELTGIEDRSKRQTALVRGYSAARVGLRSDLLGRGDLTGIPARLRDMELNLGLVPLPDDKRKQVTVRFGFEVSPISLTGFSIEGRNLSFDERFSAEGDWLAGLRVKVRNDSGRTIKSVSLGISFPETSRTGSEMGSNLHYGPNPITQAEAENQPRVAPGQSFEIGIGKYPGSLKKFLETRQSFDTISRMLLDISYIDFEDGTRWSGGQYTKPDPENPKRRIPIRTN